MRAFAVLIGLITSVFGSYGAYAAMRAVGPENQAGNFGFGDAAVEPPGGGTLLQSRNFARVVDALKRELGSEGAVQNLNVELLGATATARKGGQMLSISIDASGRSRSTEAGEASPAALVPVSKIDPAAIDKLTAAARKETNDVPVESLSLAGGSREWTVNMLRGEPDSFIANLDGGGLRLSGEPNPEPIGASADSMFQHKNLEDVLEAAKEEGDELIDLSIWPERVSVQLAAGGREIVLDYGYDAQLTSRDVRARTGAPQKTVPISKINIRAIERMARHKEVGGLKNVQYVLLNPADVFSSKAMLSMYLQPGRDRAYVIADLNGHGLTWPGRG